MGKKKRLHNTRKSHSERKSWEQDIDHYQSITTTRLRPPVMLAARPAHTCIVEG